MRRSLALPALLLLLGCPESRNPGGGGPAADTGAVPQDSGMTSDASAAPDAEETADTGAADGRTFLDANGIDARDLPDGGIGPSCTELEACCPEVPGQLQAQCTNAVASGDEGMCAQALGIAQQLGYCLGPQPDASPRDAGPLGPACADYQLCCPELGPLQMRCETTAAAGDENACQQALSIARNFGLCQGSADGAVNIPDLGLPSFDADFPDLGIPFDDAGFPIFDAQLPDIGPPLFDAGGPFTPDAGPPADGSLRD